MSLYAPIVGPVERAIAAQSAAARRRLETARPPLRPLPPVEVAPPPVVEVAAPPVPDDAPDWPPTTAPVLWPWERRERITIAGIQEAVCRHFGVRVRDLMSSRRTKDVVRPRQIAMYLAKGLTPHALTAIGRHFGGKDHTTVIHALRRVEELIAGDAALAAAVDAIRATLLRLP